MRTERAPLWQRVLYVLAWPVSSLLALVDLVIMRAVVLDLLTLVGTRKATRSESREFGWLVEFLDWGMVLAIAIVGVALAVAFEYYFRRGLAGGRFLQRLLRVLAILLGVGAAGLLAQALI